MDNQQVDVEALSRSQHQIEEVCDLSSKDLEERIKIMLGTEANYLPLANYIETVQRDGMRVLWRRKVSCWLLEFQEEFGISQDTVAVAVNYMDRYLSQISTKKSILQLLAMGAVFIAAKLHETYPIGMNELQSLAEGMYLESDIKLMELELLRVIQWHLNPVTPQCFMNHMVHYAKCPTKRRLLREHAEAFLDVALCEYEFLNFLPSVQGVAAILCAFETTKLPAGPWIAAVQKYGIVTAPITLQCKNRMKQVFYNSYPDIARSQADSPTGVDELIAAEGENHAHYEDETVKSLHVETAAAVATTTTAPPPSTADQQKMKSSPVAFCEVSVTNSSNSSGVQVRPVPVYAKAQAPPAAAVASKSSASQNVQIPLSTSTTPPEHGINTKPRALTH